MIQPQNGTAYRGKRTSPDPLRVRNSRQIDTAKLVRELRAKHDLVIDGGYGKIKGETFRFSNMRDETEATVSHLLTCLDDCLKGQD